MSHDIGLVTVWTMQHLGNHGLPPPHNWWRSSSTEDTRSTALKHLPKDLHVLHAICILWVFEPCTHLDMINLYFPWVERVLASCTDGAIPQQYFLSEIYPSWPVFSEVDVVIAEKAFSLDAFLFLFDVILLGVGVMPGLGHKSFGFVLGWHDQLSCFVSEGVILAESLHYCWHVALVFAT